MKIITAMTDKEPVAKKEEHPVLPFAYRLGELIGSLCVTLGVPISMGRIAGARNPGQRGYGRIGNKRHRRKMQGE